LYCPPSSSTSPSVICHSPTVAASEGGEVRGSNTLLPPHTPCPTTGEGAAVLPAGCRGRARLPPSPILPCPQRGPISLPNTLRWRDQSRRGDCGADVRGIDSRTGLNEKGDVGAGLTNLGCAQEGGALLLQAAPLCTGRASARWRCEVFTPPPITFFFRVDAASTAAELSPHPRLSCRFRLPISCFSAGRWRYA
jgi:hypothetical protein